ncbi:hypothetical protein Tco_0211961 [Tanacetum coccineum]
MEDITTGFLAQVFSRDSGHAEDKEGGNGLRTIGQSVGGKLRDLNPKESWALLEDLALCDNESWNNPRDFAKPIKAIALPQDVLRNSMAHKNIVAISHDEKEELRKKGIKSPSNLFSLKYISPASIKELNKNPSTPKRVYFVNSIVILSTDKHGKEDDEIETDIEIEEAIKDEESEFETDEEVEERFEEEEEDEDDESFNSFPTMKELSHYEWLLKHPRPPWVKAKNPLKPNEISNFVGIVKSIKVFIGSFTYECDFMILEDTGSIIDHHLGEMVFGKPFTDETGLAYYKEKGTVMLKQGDEKITFTMPYAMEIFKQAWLMRLSTNSIPPSAHEENFGHGKMHYHQSLLIGDEYRQDEGDRRGIRHLMRLEKEMMDNKGEVT